MYKFDFCQKQLNVICKQGCCIRKLFCQWKLQQEMYCHNFSSSVQSVIILRGWIRMRGCSDETNHIWAKLWKSILWSPHPFLKSLSTNEFSLFLTLVKCFSLNCSRLFLFPWSYTNFLYSHIFILYEIEVLSRINKMN